MLRRHPVITGVGLVTAAGCGSDAVWNALRQGHTGLGRLTLFPSNRHAQHLAGQLPWAVDCATPGVRGSRTDRIVWLAVQQAVTQAGLQSWTRFFRAERIGLALGITTGGIRGTESVVERWFHDRRWRPGPLRYHECATATDLCAQRLGWRGPSLTLSTACSAGAMAIAAAAELIEEGEADVMVAGGGDSLCRLTLNGFGSLLLLDPRGCRPFDADRDGISLGEGAGILVLEAADSARARGARVLARLSGWGASCDAYHATAPHPEGDGALAAMQQALRRGELHPADIHYISAHGTGTRDNDAMEGRALQRLFGESVPPFSSTKRFFGHTLAASGPIQAAVCLRALEEQALPPNAGWEKLDPKIGLEPVRELRAHAMTHVVSNSFGFGGSNVALVFSRAEARPISPPGAALPEDPSKGQFAVLGCGFFSPAGGTLPEVAAAFQAGGAKVSLFQGESPLQLSGLPVYVCDESATVSLLPSARRRKLGRLQQMAIAAARQSLPIDQAARPAPGRVCVAMGTGLGCLEETRAFVENLVARDEASPLPAKFTNSVHNALASQIALEFSFRGLNSTTTQREISFETALWHATRELHLGQADLAVAGAADELSGYVLSAGSRWGWWQPESPPLRPFAGEISPRQRPLPGEGAAVFALGGQDQIKGALASVCAIRFGRFAGTTTSAFDAEAEAEWMSQTLEREGLTLQSLDLLLLGANGWPRLDEFYLAAAQALSRRAGRTLPYRAYKQSFGEFYSASAFGFLTALGVVRGDIPAASLCRETAPSRPCRRVLLYTLAPTGTKAMCCVCAAP